MSLTELIKEFKLPIKVCEDCRGEGEISVFCGHDSMEYCRSCEGKGYKSICNHIRYINKKGILKCQMCGEILKEEINE